MLSRPGRNVSLLSWCQYLDEKTTHTDLVILKTLKEESESVGQTPKNNFWEKRIELLSIDASLRRSNDWRCYILLSLLCLHVPFAQILCTDEIISVPGYSRGCLSFFPRKIHLYHRIAFSIINTTPFLASVVFFPFPVHAAFHHLNLFISY